MAVKGIGGAATLSIASSSQSRLRQSLTKAYWGLLESMEVDMRLRPCNIQLEDPVRIKPARWRLSYLSWPIHHPCHKHATWSDTATHSQQWLDRWPQFWSQKYKSQRSFSFKDLNTIQCGEVRKGKLLLLSSSRGHYLSPLTFPSFLVLIM